MNAYRSTSLVMAALTSAALCGTAWAADPPASGPSSTTPHATTASGKSDRESKGTLASELARCKVMSGAEKQACERDARAAAKSGAQQRSGSR